MIFHVELLNVSLRLCRFHGPSWPSCTCLPWESFPVPPVRSIFQSPN